MAVGRGEVAGEGAEEPGEAGAVEGGGGAVAAPGEGDRQSATTRL